MFKLLEHSVGYLKRWYGTDMKKWQEQWNLSSDSEEYIPLGFRPAHAISVVNLARLTGESSILPTAFLDCCVLDEWIIDGFDHADGSHEELAFNDLRCCLKARSDLAAAGVSVFTRAYSPEPSAKCMTTESCREAFHAALLRIDGLAFDVTYLDLFKPLPRLGELDDIPLCSHCIDKAMKRGREA